MESKNSVALSKRANGLAGREWLLNSFSIWRGLGKSHGERSLDHPAIFTMSLVSKLLETYSHCHESEVLLDPFAGSGTALLAANHKGMKSIGLDINENFKKTFLERIDIMTNINNCDYHICDAQEMTKVVAPQSIDICITSPPYWDILSRRRSADGKNARPYSERDDDLGNMASYEDFLASLRKIFAGIYFAIKPKKIFILNVMDIRKKSKFYPLHIDAIKQAELCGFNLDDIIIWDRQDEYNNMRPLGYPYKFIINKVHEYLLVFRK